MGGDPLAADETQRPHGDGYVGEGLDMLLKILQESERAAWPRVVNNGVVTGEFRETLLGLADLWKGQAPKAEETQSAPTLGSGGPAQGAIPPAAQQQQGPSAMDGSVHESDSSGNLL